MPARGGSSGDNCKLLFDSFFYFPFPSPSYSYNALVMEKEGNISLDLLSQQLDHPLDDHFPNFALPALVMLLLAGA